MQFSAAALEQAEFRFRRALWSAAPADAVEEAGVCMRSFGPVLASVYGEYPELTVLNAIQGAAEPGAVERGHLGRAVDWVREWEVDYAVLVAHDQPGCRGAESWLESRGYEQGAVVRRYLRAAGDPGGSEPPGVEVLELGPEEGEGMDALAAEVHGLPAMAGIVLFCALPSLEGWRCYVALLDGELVACGSMLLADGVATLGIDATAPHARGHGCHRALLRRRLADAAEAGCDVAVAEACDQPGRGRPAAARNLLHAGFAEVSRSVAWHPARRASLV